MLTHTLPCCLFCAGVFAARRTNALYKYFTLAHFPPWFHNKKKKKEKVTHKQVPLQHK